VKGEERGRKEEEKGK